MQINGTTISQEQRQQHINNDSVNTTICEEEYDCENYVIMSRKWSRPPPPPKRRSLWWKINSTSPYHYDDDGDGEEEEDISMHYDESLVVIDKGKINSTLHTNNINQNNNPVEMSVPQCKEKTFTKWRRRGRSAMTNITNPEHKHNHIIIPDGNYDESLLLEEETRIVDEEFVVNNASTSPEGMQIHQYMAPNLEYMYNAGEEFTMAIDDDDRENDIEIGSCVDDKANTEIFNKHKIELKEYSQINKDSNETKQDIITPKPNKRRPRVTWHNVMETDQNIINGDNNKSISPSSSFKSQSNTIQRSVFYSQSANGRIQFRLPSDKIHLVMDESIEPGTLLLLHPIDAASHRLPLLVTSPSADIMDIFHSMEYVFTVDQNLYKQVVKEISDSALIPCGFYYCCHEAGENKVNIWVAVIILFFVFSFFLAVTMIWPIE